jgi:hypothetical protein
MSQTKLFEPLQTRPRHATEPRRWRHYFNAQPPGMVPSPLAVDYTVNASAD